MQLPPFGGNTEVNDMLDIHNVTLIFKQLSGCPDEDMNGNIPLIYTAALKVERVLDEDKICEGDIPACEYAAACCALYDFACTQASKEKLIVTAEGKASLRDDLTHRVSAALELKRSALAAIRDFMLGGDFHFAAV